MQKKLRLYSICIVSFILVAHLLAYQFYWYSSVWWYDMFMHFIGGVFLAILFGLVAQKSVQKHSNIELIILMLLFILGVGFGWEIFEYIVQFIFKPTPFANIPDSLSDLLCDVTGGIVGIYFVIRAKRRYNSTHEHFEVA